MSGAKEWERSGRVEGIRLPLIRTEADIDELPHLSSEEKAMAKENQAKTPASDCLSLMGNDPELQGLFILMERACEALLAPDYQSVPFDPMNLIAIEVARQTQCEFFVSVFEQVTVGAIDKFKKKDAQARQLGMFEYPDSKVWTEDQRLVLKFTKACCKNEMTDELFGEARKTWGEKKLLRIMLWIGFLYIPYIISNACNLTSDPTKETPIWSMFPPEALTFVHQMNDKTCKELLSVWASTDKLPLDV
ncbi:MAG: hypothetical protein KJP07_02350 [Desulfatitalea sp.]|nr:hypothetical protein [Desulfatitalea sp.]